MRAKTLFSCFGLAVLMLLLLASRSDACSCAELTPCQSFGYASAVFVGRMIDGSEKVREGTKDGKTIYYEAGRVRFTVEESFKGVSTTEITIYVLNLRGTSCEGTALARGETYLVYASLAGSIGLSVGPCSPTKPLSSAGADLDFLRGLPRPGVGGRLYGQVAVETGGRQTSPLAGVSITVEDEAHQVIRVKTDLVGKYEINGLKPGKYLITPILPEHYVARDDYQRNREAQVSDRGCTYAPFWVNVNGHISGTISDSSGRPAPADLTLTSVGEPERILITQTDYNGQYDIDGISPGQYVLQVDLRKEEKEEPYFYPGTTDKSKAFVIKLGLGEGIKGYDFHLPPQLQVRFLRGVIKYSDGRAAGAVEVRLAPERAEKTGAYRANDMYTEAITDAQGRFKLQGYKGTIYRIIVIEGLRIAIDEKRKPARAELRNVNPQEDLDGIEVVLPLEGKTGESKEKERPPKSPE